VTEFTFQPSVVTVKVGQIVTWSFEGELEHELKFADSAAPPFRLREGQYSRRDHAPLTVEYTCSIHPQMKGTLIVEP
jgi:plastocyanin